MGKRWGQIFNIELTLNKLSWTRAKIEDLTIFPKFKVKDLTPF
jgi:hypothetical protein